MLVRSLGALVVALVGDSVPQAGRAIKTGSTARRVDAQIVSALKHGL